MDKANVFGAALAYILFILLTAWLIMLGLGTLNVSVPFVGILLLVVASRFLYVIIKGAFTSE